MNSQACCVNQAPNTTPSGVTCTQTNVLARTANVTWTGFGAASGCSQPWGHNCVGNTNSFQLRFSGGKSNESAASSATSLTTGVFPNWGTYTVQVCALNGAAERCSGTVNCVLTAPPCTVSNQDVTDIASDPTCRNTDPPLSATIGNNANEIQFTVDTTSVFASPYSAQSVWGTATAYTPSLATGRYYWNAISRSNLTPVACTAPATIPAGLELNIDKTSPTIPGDPAVTWIPDAACLTRYSPRLDWSASTDSGCAGLHLAGSYQAHVSNNSSYASNPSPNFLQDSSWISVRQYQTTNSYEGGTTLYGRVRARDNINNTSAWTSTAATAMVVPSPTPYPTIWIRGTYQEDMGSSGTPDCTGGMTIDPNLFDVTLNVTGIGASYVCNKYPTEYECFVTVDNRGTDCVVPNHDISIVASYGGYDDVEWREGNSCDGDPIVEIPIDTSNPDPNPTPIETFFKYGEKGWFKMRDASFINKINRENTLPNNPSDFDGAQPDDSVVPPNNKHLIIGEAGTALYNSAGKNIELGANATLGFSANRWFSSSYDSLTLFSRTKFFDYVKSRKQYATITALNQITENGIYYVANNLEITDDAVFDGKKVLLVVGGTVTISTPAFTPASGSVGIIAEDILIDGNTTEIDAILIGNRIDVGDSANKLKINGNLIQLGTLDPFNNSRILTSAQSPSLFIKVNHATYVDLLPYLSTSLYDWRQIQ